MAAILKVCLSKIVPSLQVCYPGLCFDVKQHFSHYNLKDSFIVARVIQVYVFCMKSAILAAILKHGAIFRLC